MRYRLTFEHLIGQQAVFDLSIEHLPELLIIAFLTHECYGLRGVFVGAERQIDCPH